MYRVKNINNELNEEVDFIFASDKGCHFYNGELVKVYLDKEDVNKCKKYGWYINKKGYVYTIFENKTLFLHRFVLNLNDKKLVIDHNDSNKLNNHKNNLLLMSNEENVRKSWQIQKTREHTKRGVIMYDFNDNNFEHPLKEFDSQKEAAIYLKNNNIETISQGSISNACCGRRKSAGGFKWRFRYEVHG